MILADFDIEENFLCYGINVYFEGLLVKGCSKVVVDCSGQNKLFGLLTPINFVEKCFNGFETLDNDKTDFIAI